MTKPGAFARPMIAAAALLAAPLGAQDTFAPSALAGFDTRAPIDIDAGRIEVRDRDRQAVFSGNVQVSQDRLRLTADEMRVFYDNVGGGLEIDRLDANGGVRMTSPSENARAASAVYDVERRIITMIGGVTLTRGANVLRGQRLVLDLDNGRTTLDGAASADIGDAGRVTGRFSVPSGNTP